jgi:two-component system, chemotaxis family, sensor kinase CheA
MNAFINISKKTRDYGKYSSLIISLSLFSLLVVSIMMLSLYVSNQLEKDTKVINTAFEQTSLLNKVVSDLYVINSQFNNGEASSFSQKRLKDTLDLIDARMQAFRYGGELPVVSVGEYNELDSVQLDPIKDARLLSQISTIVPLWEEYKRRVLPALSFDSLLSKKNSDFNRYEFYGSVLYNQGAVRGLERINLHNKVDSFALQLQKESDDRLNVLRISQVVGIAITGVSLVLILFFIVGQLRRSDSDLENAREETKGILSTVQEGLFLIHKDNTIGQEYSVELEKILGTNNISGREIFDLLGDVISGQDAKNLQTFIGSLFNPRVVDSLIMDLNPLRNLHVNIDNGDGYFEEKYLSFSFFRVIKKRNIGDILVSVKDITDNVVLQNKLKVTESKSEEQFKMFVSLINVNVNTLKLFLSNSFTALNKINNILKSGMSGGVDLIDKSNEVFFYIHSFKGEASSLGLKSVSEKAHEFETELARLKMAGDGDGKKFIPLTIMLKELISGLDNIRDVSKKIHGLKSSEDGGGSSEKASSAEEWKHLNNVVVEMTEKYNKKADLVLCGLRELSVNNELKKVINSILVHFIKNSVVHGIESPSERIQSDKPEVGRIDVKAAELSSGFLELVVRDDGRGLDSNKIAIKLVEKAIVSQDKIKRMSSSEINKYIFFPGFSTAGVDIHAGRGVGLAAILQSIKELGGNINVQQNKGRYCQFSITIPMSVSVSI